MSIHEKSLYPYARTRQLLALLLAAPLAMTALSPAWSHDQGGNDDDDDDAVYEIGLWGDLPYSDTQINVGVPNLIKDMNAHDLKFTAHDGDLRQGSGSPFCDDALYTRSLAYFNSLKAPAIFTPGDNDWTDCDRQAGVSSRERLDHERQVFFSKPYTLGQHRFRQEVQTDKLCLGVNGKVSCVENRRWVLGRVTYATVNVQGSCDNLCDTLPDPDEHAARSAAAIQWVKETFAEAKKNNSVAVMLITQADPGFDQTGAQFEPKRDPQTLAETDGNPDGFVEYLTALRDEVIAFRKPVAYVHGDSHYFRIDSPFKDSLGQRLENFTRVETFGDNQQNGNNDARWLKVHVDPKSRDVFYYQPVNVPGNRTAVPAPAADDQHDARNDDNGQGGHK